MRAQPGSWMVLPVVVLAAGCDVPDERLASASQGVVRSNGIELNGIELNGIELNGIELNGIELNGIELNGIELDGVELSGIQLVGAELRGRAPDGTLVGGVDLAGAHLIAVFSDGRTGSLTIDAIHPDPDPGHADILLYLVSLETDHGPVPLCGAGGGASSWALPLAGAWDHATGARRAGSDLFTFACTGAALAKCARMGYKPWGAAIVCRGEDCSAASLADHHQACTRMLRADYCGDGHPYTIDGDAIDVYDGLGLQVPATQGDPRWAFEAEWRPDGAACLSRARFPRLLHEQGRIPRCVEQRLESGCGERARFAMGTLLMNRSRRQPPGRPGQVEAP